MNQHGSHLGCQMPTTFTNLYHGYYKCTLPSMDLALSQGEWIYLVDFLPFFTRKTTLVTSCLLSCVCIPFRGVYFKRKEFAPPPHPPHPLWSKVNFETAVFLESVSIPLKVFIVFIHGGQIIGPKRVAQ